ncbi:MAG: Mrp/NBP35 family ATP-binding protein [Myxococcales bacterium]|nr:Mrp/NBP35 family ATP-binding protein [Myxococcales bacterium]
MSIDLAAARAALAAVRDSDGRPLTELGVVRELELEGDAVRVGIALTEPSAALQERLGAAVTEALRALGAAAVKLRWSTQVAAREMGEDDPCPGVRNIVLVTSGKGGVGKSTVATNLALALSRSGHRVGLLDADMYGPSIPTMLGVMGRPTAAPDGRITPLERFGVKLMSIGFLLENERSAVIWRGPMLQGALLQFLKDVDWGELDYLVLDLPPGTGDVAITLAQRVRTTGAVVVTTPQAVALADVFKSVAMLRKVGIAVLGVIENESYFVCDGCDKRHELFGSGGGAQIAEFAEAPLLGQIPLDPAIREWGDAGTPVVQAAPSSSVARAFAAVAEQLVERVELANGARQPTLTIDRSGGKNRHLPITR